MRKIKVVLIVLLVMVGVSHGAFFDDVSGGSGGLTVTVAASDAPVHIKACADYLCDGTADNVQIQLAIDTAVSHNNFATIELSEGTFNIAATIYHCGTPAHLAGGVGVSPTVFIKGSGVKCTQLNLVADVNMFTFGRYEQTIFSGISDLLATGNSSSRTSGNFLNYEYEGSGATDVDLLYDFNLRNLFIQDFRDSGIICKGNSWGWILDNVIIEFCGRHVRVGDGVTPGVTTKSLNASVVTSATSVSGNNVQTFTLTDHGYTAGDVIGIRGGLGGQGLKLNGFWTVASVVDDNNFTIFQSWDTYTQTGDEEILSNFSHGAEFIDCGYGPKISACKFITNEGCGLLLNRSDRTLISNSEFNGVSEGTPGIAIFGGKSNFANNNRFVVPIMNNIDSTTGIVLGKSAITNTTLNIINNNTFDFTAVAMQYGIQMDRSSSYCTIAGNSFNPYGTPTTSGDLRITGNGSALDGTTKRGGTNASKFSATNKIKSDNGGKATGLSTGGTIAHGLNGTPTIVSVTPASAGVSDLNIAVDGTNITVTFAGGGSEDFYWYVKSD